MVGTLTGWQEGRILVVKAFSANQAEVSNSSVGVRKRWRD